MSDGTEFAVSTDVDPSGTLLVGLAERGLAGLPAVDRMYD